jgi:hypothetical protein
MMYRGVTDILRQQFPLLLFTGILCRCPDGTERRVFDEATYDVYRPNYNFKYRETIVHFQATLRYSPTSIMESLMFIRFINLRVWIVVYKNHSVMSIKLIFNIGKYSDLVHFERQKFH